MRSNLVGFILLAFCLFLGRERIFHLFKAHPKRVPATIAQGPQCSGKKLCGLIYVAPWCPGCNQLVPVFQSMVQTAPRNEEMGLKVIVGKGRTPEENAAKAQELGTGVIVDHDESYFTQLAIDRYPTFLVTDPTGKVVMRDGEAFTWMNRSFSGF